MASVGRPIRLTTPLAPNRPARALARLPGRRVPLLARLALVLAALAGGLYAQLPPPQPASGPGGSDYNFASFQVHGPFPPTSYYLFTPSPAPAAAPVALVLPGAGFGSPQQYFGLIGHLARKGYSVAWVPWISLDPGSWISWNYATNAGAVWSDALTRLEGIVPPLKDGAGRPLTGFIGHSIGGWVAGVMASRVGLGVTSSFPMPKAIVGVAPSAGFAWPEDMRGVSPETVLVAVLGASDNVGCTRAVEELWKAPVPDQRRDILVVHEQTRGAISLRAWHDFPTGWFAPFGGVDSVDYFAVYKLAEAALDCGVYGTNCGVAVGNGAAAQVTMGVWSDGLPVSPMTWAASPASVPRIPGCP